MERLLRELGDRYRSAFYVDSIGSLESYVIERLARLQKRRVMGSTSAGSIAGMTIRSRLVGRWMIFEEIACVINASANFDCWYWMPEVSVKVYRFDEDSIEAVVALGDR
jgi:hypothetical protein